MPIDITGKFQPSDGAHGFDLLDIQDVAPVGLTASELLRANAGLTAIESAGVTVASFEAAGATATHAALTATHGVAGAIVGTTDTQTLSNKTLTLPQINDTSADHQYVFAVSELVADRTVTLPLLTGADEFVFKDHTQTLTNKTLTTPTIGSFLNANHTHAAAGATGGTLNASAIAAGTLVHERGGLEADVSAYNGILYISGGTTDSYAVPLGLAYGGSAGDLGSGSHPSEIIQMNAADTALECSGKVLPTGTVVGTSDTQTLTAKTLTSPKIGTSVCKSDGTGMLLEADIGVVTKVIHVPDPVSGDVFAFDFTDSKLTFLGVWGETDAGSVVLNIEKRVWTDSEAAGTAGVEILSADLTADDDGATTTSFAATVDGSSTPLWLCLVLGTVTTATDLKVAVKYKRYA